ncbi:MAG: sulfatase-like hydrolase/transferase, partial [Opitutales bacterium]|nr:sulfatase-like hydrolase/transferase [Opitutales bacterium]
MKSISRISAILIACAALHILEPSSEDAIAASSKNDRPNVLFIMTDDQSRDQFNFLPEGRDEQGKPRNLTPNINRLVANGIAFPNHYASTPVCTPSRFTVLTGMYASRANDYAESAARGEQVNISWNCHIDAETQNIARMLSDAGYFTGAVGKNHVIAGHHKKRISIPFDRSAHEPDVAALLKKKQANQVLSYQECGFDFAASLFAGNLGNRHNTEDTVFHNMDWITQGAMDFFESWQKTEKPFYLYFATTLDHGPGPAKLKYTGDPLATPAGFLEKPLTVQPSRASIPERVTAAGLSLDTTACDVLWMDDAIGALLDRLETM